MKPLRVGIDAHIVGAGKGGVERFLREVCTRLPLLAPQHEYVLFCNAEAIADGTLRSSDRVELVALPFSNPLIERALVLPWLARRHGLDVLLVQRLAPWAMGRCRVALTVHDITPIKFPRAYRGLTNALVRLLTASSVRRSQIVLTPALVIAHEVAELTGEAPGKFHAYYNGVDTGLFHPPPDAPARAAIARRLGAQTPFVFTSGALERRKNVETAIRAMRHVPQAVCGQLVVAGGTRDTGYAAELGGLVTQLGLQTRVRMMGFISDADLADLYRAATAFVSASRDEGFNMPMLEAMASGVATLCSDIPVHRELFDGATAFFPADDDAALGTQLSRLLSDAAARSELALAGLERSRRYTWDSAAGRVGAALEEACVAR